MIVKRAKFLIIIILSDAGLLQKFSVNSCVRAFAEFDLLHCAYTVELFDTIDALMLLC